MKKIKLLVFCVDVGGPLEILNYQLPAICWKTGRVVGLAYRSYLGFETAIKEFVEALVGLGSLEEIFGINFESFDKG